MKSWSFTAVLLLAFILLLPLSIQQGKAQQTIAVTADPSFVNLGMLVSIGVNSDATDTFTVTVVKPDGSTESQLNYTFSSPGSINQTYGNSTIDYLSQIDQTGTYRVYVTLANNTAELASTTFFATDQLNIDLSVADSGTTDNVCPITTQFYRGTSIVPRMHVKYASTGGYMTISNSPNATVTFTMPPNTLGTYELPSPAENQDQMPPGVILTRFASYLPPEGAWRNCFRPNWNFPTGYWNITAEANDGKGNYGRVVSYQLGYQPVTFPQFVLRMAYEITPAPLTISADVYDKATGKLATNNLTQYQELAVEVRVEYRHPLGPLGRESHSEYLGLLNTTRNGDVTAKLGWGFYNETSKTFGGTDISENPGQLIATIPLNYNSQSGNWSATYSITGSEPVENYILVIDARDGANAPNIGNTKVHLLPIPEIVEKTLEVPVEVTVEIIPTSVYLAIGGLSLVTVIAVVATLLARRK